MTQRFDFEWQISDPDDAGLVHVRERLCGTDKENLFGPIPAKIAPSFIRARRDFVHRFITTQAQAFHVFEPRPLVISPTGVPKYDA